MAPGALQQPPSPQHQSPNLRHRGSPVGQLAKLASIKAGLQAGGRWEDTCSVSGTAGQHWRLSCTNTRAASCRACHHGWNLRHPLCRPLPLLAGTHRILVIRGTVGCSATDAGAQVGRLGSVCTDMMPQTEQGAIPPIGHQCTHQCWCPVREGFRLQDGRWQNATGLPA